MFTPVHFVMLGQRLASLPTLVEDHRKLPCSSHLYISTINIYIFERLIWESYQPTDDTLRNLFDHWKWIHPCIEARLVLDYVPNTGQHLLVHQHIRHNSLLVFGLHNLVKCSSCIKLSPADVQTDHGLPSDKGERKWFSVQSSKEQLTSEDWALRAGFPQSIGEGSPDLCYTFWMDEGVV